MNRTLKFVTLGVIVSVALVMGSVAVGQILATDDYTAGSLAEIEEHTGYVLKNCSGYVGVYYQDTGYPAFVTDIPLVGLREVDRAEIESGFSVGSRTELMQILEDLGS